MSKLKLEIEALSVESFAIAGSDAARGTVAGHIVTVYPTNLQSCGYNTGGYNSCFQTCFDGVCQSENQTYLESCVPNQCPNSYDQQCETFGGAVGCYYPVKPPQKL